MQTRIKVEKSGTDAMHAMLGVEKVLARSSVEKSVRELIKIRVSQINGCAYCIDMHWKDARASGESEQRLYGVSAWRESPYYSDRERAGLLLAEELTRVADRAVPDEVFEKAKTQFSDEELGDVVWVIAAINAWNRVNVGYGTIGGSYEPPKHSAAES
jgi:AhpD family alkylhydroperoxidase